MTLRLLVQVQGVFQQGDLFQGLSALPLPIFLNIFFNGFPLCCCLYLLPVVQNIWLILLEGLPCTFGSKWKAGASTRLNSLLKRDGDEECQGSPLYRLPEVFKMLFSLCGCPFKPHLCQAFQYTFTVLLLKSAFPTVLFAELARQHGCNPLAR